MARATQAQVANLEADLKVCREMLQGKMQELAKLQDAWAAMDKEHWGIRAHLKNQIEEAYLSKTKADDDYAAAKKNGDYYSKQNSDYALTESAIHSILDLVPSPPPREHGTYNTTVPLLTRFAVYLATRNQPPQPL